MTYIYVDLLHRVRVANELGAGNGKAAKFATQVSVTQSTVIGLLFCVLIMIFHNQFAYIFTSSSSVLQAVDDMSILLAVTILLNSVQPVLSGKKKLLIIYLTSHNIYQESRTPKRNLKILLKKKVEIKGI